MARRIIDISVALQNDIASDPPGQEPRITYTAHKAGASLICRHFPGLTPQDLPDGEGWAVERIDISTHNGTHLDAPWRPWTAAGAPSPSMRCRSNGASSRE
jgi:kynurenine formamidase